MAPLVQFSSLQLEVYRYVFYRSCLYTVMCGADVNRLADGTTVIDIDQPSSRTDLQQVVINVPDIVQFQTPVDGSTPSPPLSSNNGTLPSQAAAGSSPSVVGKVQGETPTADVSVAVKSPAGPAPHVAKSTTSRRTAKTLNNAAQVRSSTLAALQCVRGKTATPPVS